MLQNSKRLLYLQCSSVKSQIMLRLCVHFETIAQRSLQLQEPLWFCDHLSDMCVCVCGNSVCVCVWFPHSWFYIFCGSWYPSPAVCTLHHISVCVDYINTWCQSGCAHLLAEMDYVGLGLKIQSDTHTHTQYFSHCCVSQCVLYLHLHKFKYLPGSTDYHSSPYAEDQTTVRQKLPTPMQLWELELAWSGHIMLHLGLTVNSLIKPKNSPRVGPVMNRASRPTTAGVRKSSQGDGWMDGRGV